MRGYRGGIRAGLGGLLAALPLLTGPAWGEGDSVVGDSAAGEAAAIKWCSRCHVIGTYNKYGGINSTPSFWIMAEKPQTYSAKLLTFQERRPHRALEFDVTQNDVENIHAYVATLKRE